MTKKHVEPSKPPKGAKVIVGTPGNDELVGTKGNDKIFGGAGDDKLIGGKGNDKLFGGKGDDKLYGGSGNDKLYGGSGNDKLYGGAGKDKINGGCGDDTIHGGAGADILIGGKGKDVFVYLSAAESNLCAWDRILDFKQGYDKIDLAALLGATDLIWGNQTATMNGAWFQNSGSKTFVYADTSGDGVADLKIELKHTPGLTLTANDFIGVAGNSAPVITSGPQAAAVTEVTDNALGENATLHAASGAVTFTDADAGDAHTASFVAGAAGYLGTFTLDPVAGNSVGWSFEVQDADLDLLRGDETRVQTYTVTVNDGKGGTASQVVTITINGTNDAPVITSGPQAAAVTEVTDNEPGENATLHSANGAVTFSDVDVGDAHTATFVAGAAGYLGTFTLGAAAGNSVGWTFEVEDADLDFLLGGVTRVQTYTVTVDDGQGGTATQDVTITINGSADALFTENNDSVDFNTLLAVNYTASTQYNALGGNDVVVLPADAAAATAAGFNQTQTFLGGPGDDRITMTVTNPLKINAGPGNDTLVLAGNAGGGMVVIDFSADDQFQGIDPLPEPLVQAGFENLDASGLTNGSIFFFAAGVSTRVVGSSGDDTIILGSGPGVVNVVKGGPGGDTIESGFAVGDDTFLYSFNLNAGALASDDGFDSIFNFGTGITGVGLGSDRFRFDVTAAADWDAGFADNAAKLAFLEGSFKLTPAAGGSMISLNNDTWSVTTVGVPFADIDAAFARVDIYVNDVLIG